MRSSTEKGDSQRRFANHRTARGAKKLDSDHVAVVSARTVYPSTVRDPKYADHVFMSGKFNPKLGRYVTKGKWQGFELYSLTLEERATCDRSCCHWQDCYGNAMHLSKRWEHGYALEAKIEAELAELSDKHPGGFVIRLHVLGDFYSVEYVQKWRKWLDQFPALHAFGYSQRPPESSIGSALWDLVAEKWDRFAIRRSLNPATEWRSFYRGVSNELSLPEKASVVRKPGVEPLEGQFACPAQEDDEVCCANCGACWNGTKTVSFIEHGKVGAPRGPRGPNKRTKDKVPQSNPTMPIAKHDGSTTARFCRHGFSLLMQCNACDREAELARPAMAPHRNDGDQIAEPGMYAVPVDSMTFQPGDMIEIGGDTIRVDGTSVDRQTTSDGTRVIFTLAGEVVDRG